jgi:hypothetical protein
VPGLCSQLAVSLMTKFSDACALYIRGKRGAPRFKRRDDSISLQYQVQEKSAAPLLSGALVRLDRIAGEVCAAVPVILHRPIPSDATIKQVALTIRGERFFVVFMLDLAGSTQAIPAHGWNSWHRPRAQIQFPRRSFSLVWPVTAGSSSACDGFSARLTVNCVPVIRIAFTPIGTF